MATKNSYRVPGTVHSTVQEYSTVQYSTGLASSTGIVKDSKTQAVLAIPTVYRVPGTVPVP